MTRVVCAARSTRSARSLPVGPGREDPPHGDDHEWQTSRGASARRSARRARRRSPPASRDPGDGRTIASACEELGIKPARFHELRTQALQGAVEAIAPGSAGRPPLPDTLPDPKVVELEAKIRDLDLELRATQVREQIALTMPHLIKPEPEPLKKTRPSKVLDRLQKDRHRRHRHP